MSRDATAPAVIYKEVPGFPGYRVGSDGTVWSCWKKQAHKPGIITDSWRLLNPKALFKGYVRVKLSRQGKTHLIGVHVLVLTSFVGPCPPGMEAAHDNGVRTDNRLSNLAWKTPLENHADKRRHGTILEGESHPRAKLNASQVREIRSQKGVKSQRELGAQYGVDHGMIGRIHRNQNWGSLPQ